MTILRDDAQSVYRAFFSARRKSGRNPERRGCIGSATSSDLRTWSTEPPIFAPNLFRARVVEFDPLPELDLPGSSGEVFRMLAEVMQRPEENRKLRPLASLIKEIDRKLTDIEDERSVLLYLRNLAMKEVSRAIGGGSTGGWDENGVLNQLVDENEKSLRDTFRGLNMGDAWVRAILAELEKEL